MAANMSGERIQANMPSARRERESSRERIRRNRNELDNRLRYLSIAEDPDSVASKMSAEQMHAKITSARRDAEALKDRMKHKKVEAGGIPFSHVPHYAVMLPPYSPPAVPLGTPKSTIKSHSRRASSTLSLGYTDTSSPTYAIPTYGDSYSSAYYAPPNDSAYSSSAYSYGTRNTMNSSTEPDEDWTKISELAERRRIQNRIAQKNYRRWSRIKSTVKC